MAKRTTPDAAAPTPDAAPTKKGPIVSRQTIETVEDVITTEEFQNLVGSFIMARAGKSYVAGSTVTVRDGRVDGQQGMPTHVLVTVHTKVG